MHDSTRFDAWKRTRSREAMVALLEGCQDTVYNLCFQVLRHRQDAEDAAQRVFLDLLKVLSQFSSDDHFRGWLYRASLQTALNQRRGERRRMRHESSTPPGTAAPLPDETADLIHEEIAGLDRDLRNVVVAHYFEKRTLAELAALGGCSTVAVWKRIQKAQECLRRSLVRAGFASGAAALAAFLESSEAVAAPPGLLSPDVLEQAAESGVPVATVVTGGLLMKSKVVAAAVLIALAGVSLLGLAVVRNRATRRDATASTPTAAAATKTVAPGRATEPVRAEAGAAGAAVPTESLETFKTFAEFWTALRKAAGRAGPDRGKALRRMGICRTDEEIARAFAEAKGKPGSWRFAREGFQNLLFNWMVADPSATAAFLKAMPRAAPEDGDVWSLVVPVFEAWIDKAPEAILALVKLLPQDLNPSKLARTIEYRIELKNDPEGFLGRLRTMTAGEDRDEAVKVAMPVWAAKDPRSAADWVERLPEDRRSQALGAIAEAWAKANLPAAREWASTYEGQHLRNAKVYERTPAVQNYTAVLDHLLRGAVQSDPRWAVETALKWETGFFQPFRQVIAAWGQKDPVGAAQYLSSSPSIQGVSLFHASYPVAEAWAEQDPRAALAWIQQFPTAAYPGQTVARILSAWTGSSGSDPRELVKEVEKLPAEFRDSARSGLVTGWSDYDPPAAAEFFRSLPAEQQTVDVADQLAGRWAHDDLEGTLAWVRELARADLRNGALASIGSTLSQIDLKRAEAIVDEISDPDARLRAIDSLLHWGAFKDPRAASEVLRKDPQAPFMTYITVAGSFAAKDPEAGLAWAQTLPEQYQERPPEYASPDQRTQERPLRIDMLQTVLMNWHARQPEAASRWLEQAPLPKATRDRLLQTLRRK